MTSCTGLDFSNYSDDGSDINNFTPFAHDAAIALMSGLHKYIYDHGQKDLSKFNGDDFGGVLSTNFTAAGMYLTHIFVTSLPLFVFTITHTILYLSLT